MTEGENSSEKLWQLNEKNTISMWAIIWGVTLVYITLATKYEELILLGMIGLGTLAIILTIIEK